MERRVVLLGASNLAMGLPAVLGTIRGQSTGPIQVLAARGHGRSYARRSRVLLRDLPGILECSLWDALADASAVGRVDALMTDVGNDIVYGATPETLIGWVETCLDRLESAGGRIIVTRLPVASLAALSRLRFEIVRRLIFPAHPLRFETMLARVNETDERLGEVASTRGVTSVPMDPAWYGLDPVHFKVGHRKDAWRRILSTWGESRDAVPKFEAPRRARPERWWFAGRERAQPQPARRLADGSELWLY